MSDALSTLSGRSSQYSSDIDELDKSILQKSLEADSYREEASKPRKTSLQDALISSVIQVLPGLIGYAATGKEGAAIGLNSGLAGGQLYEQGLEEDYNAGVKQNTLKANQIDKEVSGLLSTKSKLEGRKYSLDDWIAKNQVTNSQKNARAGQISESNNAVASQFAQLLGDKLEGGSADDVIEPSTDSTAASLTTEEISNSQKIFDNFQKSGKGLDFLLNGTDEAKKVLDAINKLRTYESGKLGDVQKQQSIDEKTPEVNLLQQPFNVGAGYIVPKKGKVTKEAATKAQELSTRYRQVIEDLSEFARLANDNDMFSRITDDEVLGELSQKRDSLLNNIQSLMSFTAENPSKAHAAVEQIKSRIPLFGAAGAELVNVFKRQFFTPSFHAKLKGLQDEMLGEVTTQFENAGYDFLSNESTEYYEVDGHKYAKMGGKLRLVE